jgi:hypothetical protein
MINLAMRRSLALATLLLLTGILPAQDVKIINDFETAAEAEKWFINEWDEKAEVDHEIPITTADLSERNATHGTKSLKRAVPSYLRCTRNPDWSGYDRLDVDVFVEGTEPVSLVIVVGDHEWETHPKEPRSFNNRYNFDVKLQPGANVVSIPVVGLYRGHIGLRNKDITHNIDPSKIVRFDLGFTASDAKAPPATVYIDHMRLVKERLPDGVLAFDFGGENQATFPGFTPITWNTVFGKDGATAGLRRALAHANQSQNDPFPTHLCGDWVQMADAEFVASVPDGDYRVWAMFNDTAEWDWYTSRFRNRWIESRGEKVFTVDRGEGGPTDYLYRFEAIEPKPGDNVWDLYMSHLYRPISFPVRAVDGAISLTFHADAAWSCRLAALVIYPERDRAADERWLTDVERRNRDEFEKRALFLGPKPKPLAPPADAVRSGCWIGYPSLSDDVTFADAPGAAGAAMTAVTAKGQRVAMTFAVRPLRDAGAGPVSLAIADLRGPAGAIPASRIDTRYVHHAVQRGFGDISYTIGPDTLRPVAGSTLALTKETTRQFVISVRVPADAPPGRYVGEARLTAGSLAATVPIALEVEDFALDETTFPMGFYGVYVPGELPTDKRQASLRELFRLMKEFGMTSYGGGPDIRFSGFDAAGAPKLDFAACDSFFAIAREEGFTGLVFDYGGPGGLAGLDNGSVIGATGRTWEKETGKPFGELQRIVWTAIDEHARAANWPVILHSYIDEPRVLSDALDLLEMQKSFRDHAPFVHAGGYYSVDWERSTPLATAVQDIFKTMPWSGLNAHAQIDLDKGREFGRDIYVYNQGRTRFSWGAYQYAEMRKGVKGRVNWHMLALYGYQFFHLDGREPDVGMINWGRDGIMPTPAFVECGEGAADFRYAITLANLIAAKPTAPAAAAAKAYLDAIDAAIPAGQRNPLPGYAGDDAFRRGCIEHIRALRNEGKPTLKPKL